MTDFRESHRSFVNTWECDENEHMNVQFYFKRFDEAARFFELDSGHGRADLALPRDRHVRYHAELHAGALTVVRSAAIEGGPLDGRVVHLMEDAETGRLAATALDWSSGALHRHTVAADEAEAALPRGLPADPLAPLAPDTVLAMGGLLSHRSIVMPGECDRRGRLAEQGHIGRFSDAAAHAWSHAGVTAGWLREHGRGRVAVEMKITHHLPAAAGEPLTLHSAVERASDRTVILHHMIRRARDGAAVASGAAVALILDLKTRRATTLPAWVGARGDGGGAG
ncbi:thioesterase family protein [Aquibium sp. A9E412]|uniref:acyl-CoA thioesterase n=1 Tax=Aquibium sp. A9E412 TaxID=2976767 RepID=UPI0025B20308|nr:thioesterase family protein [Aquibium sp. A9E412]MDN2566679.1 thioesterase family protein [Aquibium sp. A9E412]